MVARGSLLLVLSQCANALIPPDPRVPQSPEVLAWEKELYKIFLPFNESHLPMGRTPGHVPFPKPMLQLKFKLKEPARIGDYIGLRTDSFMECASHDSPMCYLGYQRVWPNSDEKKRDEGEIMFPPISAFAITPTPVQFRFKYMSLNPVNRVESDLFIIAGGADEMYSVWVEPRQYMIGSSLDIVYKRPINLPLEPQTEWVALVRKGFCRPAAVEDSKGCQDKADLWQWIDPEFWSNQTGIGRVAISEDDARANLLPGLKYDVHYFSTKPAPNPWVPKSQMKTGFDPAAAFLSATYSNMRSNKAPKNASEESLRVAQMCSPLMTTTEWLPRDDKLELLKELEIHKDVVIIWTGKADHNPDDLIGLYEIDDCYALPPVQVKQDCYKGKLLRLGGQGEEEVELEIPKEDLMSGGNSVLDGNKQYSLRMFKAESMAKGKWDMPIFPQPAPWKNIKRAQEEDEE